MPDSITEFYSVDSISRALRCRWLAANAGFFSEFFHILAMYFHETRGSLNFLTVHSCSQNLPLITCMYAYKFQRRLALLCL